MGVDRMVMFLSNHYVRTVSTRSVCETLLTLHLKIQSIREVLTFPYMKDVVEEKKQTAAEVVDITPKPEEGIRKFIVLLKMMLRKI